MNIHSSINAHRHILIALFFTCFVALSPVVRAAGNSGTEFWLMFPKDFGGVITQSLIIASQAGASGTVTITGLGFSAPFTVAPNSTVTVVLPSNAFCAQDDGIDSTAIHVISDNDVTVCCLTYLTYSSEAYLGLPVVSLGTYYMVLTYGAGYMGPQVDVAAAFDNTTVTITPSANAGARLAGVPYTVNLSRGSVYQLYAAGGSDLTGTMITADKPVAVLGGNRCAGVPGSTGSCNMVMEQMPPVNTWGKAFVTELTSTRVSDNFKFVASQDNTTLSINGAAVATINKGKSYETVLTAPSYITADKPVLAAKFVRSWNSDASAKGDPAMILLAPIQQYAKNYIVGTPAAGWPDNNYINVAVDTANITNIILDGSAVPPAFFSPVPGGTYSVAQLAVAAGNHILSSTAAFGIELYGLSYADGYGCLGGSDLVDLEQSPTITPTWTVSPTITQTPTASTTNTVTVTNTVTATITPTPTSTMTSTFTATPTGTQTITPTVTPTYTPTATPVFCFTVKGVFPQPAASNANIVYYLCRASNVNASIYTVSGETVRKAALAGNAGYNTFYWDVCNNSGKECASGVFIYCIEAASGSEREKLWGKVVVVK